MTSRGRELVIILGQHRTGTSALAGALEACGLDFGPADRSGTHHNERGHFENPAITFLCEALLTPWTERPTFGSAHEELAEKVLGEYRGNTLGIEAREALYLLPFWSRRSARIRLVATLRHPLGFARSYRARSASNALSRGLEPARFVPDLDALVAEWSRYYEDIVALRREIVFPIVDFYLPIDDYFLELERTVRALDLDYHDDEVRGFISDGLRHDVEHDPPPESVAELYGELRRFATAPVLSVDAPGDEIARASSKIGVRRGEPPAPEALFVGWQNAYTALTETTVQLQHSTRVMTERLAETQTTFDRQRAELLASVEEAQATFDRQRTELLNAAVQAGAAHLKEREELLSRFLDAQAVYARQHAEVLQSSAAAQAEYEREHAGLLQKVADAQAEYAAQRAMLMREIEGRDARIAALATNSASPTEARLRRGMEQGSG